MKHIITVTIALENIGSHAEHNLTDLAERVRKGCVEVTENETKKGNMFTAPENESKCSIRITTNVYK